MEAKQLLSTALGPSDPDDGDAGRQIRGMAIAARVKIKRNKLGYQVPSQSGNGSYVVSLAADYCSCPDFELRDKACKHMHAVELYLQREGETEGRVVQHTVDAQGEDVSPLAPASTALLVPDPPKLERVQSDLVLPSMPIPRRNPDTTQNWPAYDAAQEYEEELFFPLLHDLCATIEQPVYEKGRPRLPLSDVVFSLGAKVYSTMSARRVRTRIRHAQADGRLDKAPCYRSINEYLRQPELTPLLEQLIELAALPLATAEEVVEYAFAIDSSGFSTNTYARWFDHKWGQEKQEANWVKAHIMAGVNTNVVTAARATVSNAHDTTYFKTLLDATAKYFGVKEVSGDKAYLSKKNLAAADAIGAKFYSPFKVNSTADAGHHRRDAQQLLWEKAYHYYHLNREEFLEHYHKRSNVETVFSMIKAKFGGSVKAKTPTAQSNEVLVKILCHNIVVLIQSMFELGISPDFRSRN